MSLINFPTVCPSSPITLKEYVSFITLGWGFDPKVFAEISKYAVDIEGYESSDLHVCCVPLWSSEQLFKEILKDLKLEMSVESAALICLLSYCKWAVIQEPNFIENYSAGKRQSLEYSYVSGMYCGVYSNLIKEIRAFLEENPDICESLKRAESETITNEEINCFLDLCFNVWYDNSGGIVKQIALERKFLNLAKRLLLEFDYLLRK